MGTKDIVIGQKPKTPVPKRNKMPNKPRKIVKSVRIAGLHPSVSVDQLCDYIVNNTSLTDQSMFSCQMLVFLQS